MMIEAHQVRYLFHPDEVLASAELLSLPCAGLNDEDAPWRIENGKALLEMNGHLQRNESGKPALSYELAFLMEGLLAAPDALEWRVEGRCVQAAVRLEDIYLVGTVLKNGKWALAPFRTAEEMTAAADENAAALPEGAIVCVRGEAEALSPEETAQYWKE